MALAAQLDRGRLAAIRRVQLLTVLWMSVEVSVSALAAARAHSIAVLAFGGDSAIELLSAVIVLTRFSGTRLSERRAARITAVLLFCLAFFIVNASVLSFLRLWSVPQPAYIGMALLIAAAVIMPWLARRKRRLSAETGSSALAADAAQSSICGWLAWIALAGLGLNAFLAIHWADPLAALAITPIVLKEGRDAWNQKMCHCC
jgi:divalent metal cation (Fe/Co/Zn/Cd) transporter